MSFLEMIAKDRAERIKALQDLLIEKYNEEYEQGNQLVVAVSVRHGDEPAVHRLMTDFEENKGIRMSYHYEEARGKEYVLIHAHQPKKKM